MSLDFLEVLENRVRDAAERIERLTAENARLKKDLEQAERERGARSDRSVEKLEKAWAKERDEIRKRTESLVERLSALLGEPGSGD